MPIYEYRCEPCNKQFETFVMTSSEPVACPTCQNAEVKKLMSTFASKVPGGYNDTYRGASSSGSAPAGESSAPAPKAGGCGGGCACH
jgi:putative FmdB family regulatory protein